MTMTKLDVSYGADPLQSLLVAYDEALKPAGGFPIACLFAGAGFRMTLMDMTHLDSEARSLVNVGVATVIVGYRDADALPAGAPPIADQVADAVAGVTYVLDHGGLWNANVSRLSLIGGSAGGFLAAAACLSLNADGARTVGQCVTLSGTTDFLTALAYWNAHGGPVGSLHENNIWTALGTKTPTTMQCEAYSPAAQVNSTNDGARWLVCNNSHEEQPVQQADILTAAIRAAGGSVTEHVGTGCSHGWRTWADNKAAVMAFIGA